MNFTEPNLKLPGNIDCILYTDNKQFYHEEVDKNMQATKPLDTVTGGKKQESPAVADKPARRLKFGSRTTQGYRK